MFSSTLAEESGKCKTTSWKCGALNRRFTPGTPLACTARACMLACEAAAARRNPSLPSSAMWMVAAVTISPWLEQMLEVALARRICCSRACSVSVAHPGPERSDEHAQGRGVGVDFCPPRHVGDGDARRCQGRRA